MFITHNLARHLYGTQSCATVSETHTSKHCTPFDNITWQHDSIAALDAMDVRLQCTSTNLVET